VRRALHNTHTQSTSFNTQHLGPTSSYIIYNLLYWGIGPPGARSAFSGCCSQSEPIFPVSNLPAAGRGNKPPAAKSPPSLPYTEPLHSPPCRRFPEGPRTDPPVCILFAGAFQHLLTAAAHRKPGGHQPPAPRAPGTRHRHQHLAPTHK
jgi:hypothetical protein